MYCPNCGRDCGEFKFCPDCGTQVCLPKSNDKEQKKELVFLEPPFAEIKVHDGRLEFGKNSVRLVTRLPRIPLKDILIPYSELFDVSYLPATKWLKGFLCVREWKDRHIPLPRTFLEKSARDSIIWFEESDNHVFFRAYEFLKQCADIVNGKGK